MKVSYAFEVRNDVKILLQICNFHCQWTIIKMAVKGKCGTLRRLSGKNCMSVGQKGNTQSDTW